VTSNQGRIVPTVGGILLFGTDRLARFPDAWIQTAKFAGSDRRRIVDCTEVRTYLPGAVAEAIVSSRST
jgi:ATP-dependent DNA helicase RecG